MRRSISAIRQMRSYRAGTNCAIALTLLVSAVSAAAQPVASIAVKMDEEEVLEGVPAAEREEHLRKLGLLVAEHAARYLPQIVPYFRWQAVAEIRPGPGVTGLVLRYHSLGVRTTYLTFERTIDGSTTENISRNVPQMRVYEPSDVDRPNTNPEELARELQKILDKHLDGLKEQLRSTIAKRLPIAQGDLTIETANGETHIVLPVAWQDLNPNASAIFRLTFSIPQKKQHIEGRVFLAPPRRYGEERILVSAPVHACKKHVIEFQLLKARQTDAECDKRLVFHYPQLAKYAVHIRNGRVYLDE